MYITKCTVKFKYIVPIKICKLIDSDNVQFTVWVQKVEDFSGADIVLPSNRSCLHTKFTFIFISLNCMRLSNYWEIWYLPSEGTFLSNSSYFIELWKKHADYVRESALKMFKIFSTTIMFYKVIVHTICKCIIISLLLQMEKLCFFR